MNARIPILLACCLLTCHVRTFAVNVDVEFVDASSVSSASGDIYVSRNVDDDDKNEQWDKDQNEGQMLTEQPAEPENDLKKFKVTTSIEDGTLSISVDASHTGNVRFWADEKKEKLHKKSWAVTGGNIINAQDAPAHSDGTEGYFWVEGLENSASLNDIEIKAKIGDEEDPVKISVIEVDLDVDSDNENGFEATGFTDVEDKIETSDEDEHPGKIVIFSPSANSDGDQVPDFADGFNLQGASGPSELAGVDSSLKFVPVQVQLKEPFDPATAKVKFTYAMSKPELSDDGLAFSGAGTEENPYVFEVNKGGMRLWKMNASERTSGQKVPQGDFIPAPTENDDAEIKWSDLASSGSRTVTLYLEYLDKETPESAGKKEIKVTAKDGDLETSDTVNVCLLPVEVVPDYNRDGKIDSADRGKVTTEKPWRFWINDNDDSGLVDGTDIPGGGSNGNDSQINGIRDLVDWFPLFLDIKELLKLFPSSEYDYTLENSNNALSMVETTLSPESAGNYLKAELGEPAQRDNPNGIALAHIAGYFKHVDAQDAKLSEGFLSSAEDGTGGVIILEATKATAEPLKLVVRKKSSGEMKVEVAFPLSIQSVENMYRHLNILAANGQSGGLATNLNEPANQPDAESSSKNFVFLHGYNVNATQSRGWFASMFKRLWHSGSRAKFTGVTWYGYESQNAVIPGVTANYQANALNAFGSASALKSGLEPLGGEVIIAAHSLGNMVVSSAMHDFGLAAEKYFLIDAAVAKECYDETEEQRLIMSHPWWEDYDDQLRATDWHLLPWPENDWRAKLTWVNRMKNIGDAYNFYSSGEEVLKNPQHGPSALPTSAEGVWAAQEKRKGFGLTGQILTSTYGGWNTNTHVDYGVRVTHSTSGALVDFIPRTQAQLGPVDAAFKQKLMQIPFFNTGFDSVTGQTLGNAPGDIANLLGPNGSDYASPSQKRNTLLTDMIPAQTTAAGSNPINSFADRNFDMNAMKTGWPATRDDQRWRHSDIREVSYTYSFLVFDQVSQISNLQE